MELVSQVPRSCGNYNYMISSLSRCLDRVLTYRNPLLTYAYRHLDNDGQRYWTYLLNWRRPATYDFFLQTDDFGVLNNYANQGIGQDYKLQ